MADYKIDDTVDITDVVCPVTFVKAKVALEELDDGQILAVRMNNGEPVQNLIPVFHANRWQEYLGISKMNMRILFIFTK